MEKVSNNVLLVAAYSFFEMGSILRIYIPIYSTIFRIPTTLRYSKLCSIPQSSILIPLLYIYILMMYFFRSSQMKIQIDTTGQSQNCFDKITTWCGLHRLTINEEKTKRLCISIKTHLLNQGISTGNTTLCNVKTYEYLGFNIDRKLTTASYTDKIIKKESYKIHTLNIMWRFLIR